VIGPSCIAISLCHSRASGNPSPMDARFRGHDK